jgi:F-type H+-transporting ATPase subunit epsilon
MADHATLDLVIASVGETRFSGEAIFVTLPGEDGEMTIFSHHEPIVTTLKSGTITVRPKEGEHKTFEVESGVFEMSSNRAVVLL